MPEWAASTPWWVVLGLAVAFGTAAVKFARWTGRVDSSLDTLAKAVAEIREDIKKLLHGQPSKTVTAGSPLRLTELGRKISEDLDAASIVDGLVSGLRYQAEGKHAYDIQELSFNFVRDEYEPSAGIDARIKQCAFENGIDRDEVLDVLAIELRDKLIALADLAPDGPEPSL